jgi:hypothetical protein
MPTPGVWEDVHQAPGCSMRGLPVDVLVFLDVGDL